MVHPSVCLLFTRVRQFFIVAEVTIEESNGDCIEAQKFIILLTLKVQNVLSVEDLLGITINSSGLFSESSCCYHGTALPKWHYSTYILKSKHVRRNAYNDIL